MNKPGERFDLIARTAFDDLMRELYQTRAENERLRGRLHLLARGSVRTKLREHPDWHIVNQAAWTDAFDGLDMVETKGIAEGSPFNGGGEHGR